MHHQSHICQPQVCTQRIIICKILLSFLWYRDRDFIIATICNCAPFMCINHKFFQSVWFQSSYHCSCGNQPSQCRWGFYQDNPRNGPFNCWDRRINQANCRWNSGWRLLKYKFNLICQTLATDNYKNASYSKSSRSPVPLVPGFLQPWQREWPCSCWCALFRLSIPGKVVLKS